MRGEKGELLSSGHRIKRDISSTNLDVLLDHVEVYRLRDDAVILRIVLQEG